MATLKGQDSPQGYTYCFIRSFIYTSCICIPIVVLYTSYFSSIIFGLWLFTGIFTSHFYIDKYSLAAKYIQLKGGPEVDHPFYSIIYVAIDNGTHLFLMWMILRFMGFPI
jgi:hypothetical protein